MDPAFYFYPYSQSQFFDRFHIPSDLLTHDIRQLIEKRGEEPINDGEHEGCYVLETRDFPSIFYRAKPISLHGHNIPIIVASLLCMPKGRTGCCLLENRVHLDYYVRGKTIEDIYQADVYAATMLAQDIANFPLEHFYERFLQQDIPLTIDEKISEESIACVDFTPLRIRFSAESIKRNGEDVDWFTVIYLHEWYHVIEQDLGRVVESAFRDHPRWKIKRKQDLPQYSLYKQPIAREEKHALNTFDVEWECENRRIKDGFYLEFAELLAELTYAKYPEVVERVRSIHAQLLGRKGYQRHLFLPQT